MEASDKKPKDGSFDDGDWIEVVQRQVSSLRFGVVQITVHDSRITQIEKTERVRFEKPKTDTRA